MFQKNKSSLKFITKLIQIPYIYDMAIANIKIY
jgi:hypothetical protein